MSCRLPSAGVTRRDVLRWGGATIPRGSFRWFGFELDGGDAGRDVDLQFTGTLRENYWRVVALIVD